jgi:hypothetical protein
MGDGGSIRAAEVDDAATIADLGRLAFATQSRQTNPRPRGLSRMRLGVRLVLADNRRLFRSCGFEEIALHRHEGFTGPTWAMMERRLE